MVKKLDAGDMLSKVEVDILDSDNYETLHDKLSIAGRNLLMKLFQKSLVVILHQKNKMMKKLRLLVISLREDEEN